VNLSTLFTMRVREGRGADDAIRGSDMFTIGVHAAIPSAQHFHPEFGYLCPSARTRRKLRSAAVTVLAGMVIAAGTALALVPQMVPHPPGDAMREQSALSIVATLPPSEQAADPAAVEKVTGDRMPATIARIPVTERPAAPASAAASTLHAQASCDDLSGAFLVPQCQLGKTGRVGKSHMTRSARDAASQRIATVSIGRADATAQGEQQKFEQPKAEQQKAAASRLVPATETAPAAVAANEASVVLPPLPPKKPVKTAQQQTPNRDAQNRDAPSRDALGRDASGRGNGGTNTTAAAPSPGFDLLGLFHHLPRPGNGAWAMSW
jgi:hypothetical protein